MSVAWPDMDGTPENQPPAGRSWWYLPRDSTRPVRSRNEVAAPLWTAAAAATLYYTRRVAAPLAAVALLAGALTLAAPGVDIADIDALAPSVIPVLRIVCFASGLIALAAAVVAAQGLPVLRMRYGVPIDASIAETLAQIPAARQRLLEVADTMSTRNDLIGALAMDLRGYPAQAHKRLMIELEQAAHAVTPERQRRCVERAHATGAEIVDTARRFREAPDDQ